MTQPRPSSRRHPRAAGVSRASAIGLVLGLLLCALPAGAQTGGDDPFGKSQFQDPALQPATTPGGPTLTVRGFVDVGYVSITQTGPEVEGGDLSWAFGNSQSTFFSESRTFTVNEVDLTLEAQRTTNGRIMGARASIDFYPSRNTEGYRLASGDRDRDVDQAFLFVQFPDGWRPRVVVGRAPGFVTLEQQEGDAPDLRLIGHTYVFQAGGGYPVGAQVLLWPVAKLAVKLGVANGGVGDYSFFPGDRSTLNRWEARDADEKSANDEAEGQTGYAALEWTALDEPAGAGTLRFGVAGASNPSLTVNSDGDAEPYAFSNVYGAYRRGMWEVRAETARLQAYYEDSIGALEAAMAYVLVSAYLGSDHLVTLRGERMTFTTDQDPDTEGSATKAGVSYRYRMDDHMHLKAEAVSETQDPQFFTPSEEETLTTNVLALSWVYSF